MLLFLILACICFAYFCVLMVHTGFTVGFSWFWIAAAVFFFLLWFIERRTSFSSKIPLWLRTGLFTSLITLGVAFAAVEGLMLFHAYEEPEPGLDYLIVLGSKVNGESASLTLENRLEAAYDYLEDNPETRAILSGGLGAEAEIAESEAMFRYLVERGIDPDRLIQEADSTSTRQNLAFSKGMMTGDHLHVGIVTSRFHVFRAVKIARKLDYGYVVGIGAESDTILFPSMLVREFIAIVKDFLVGNL